MVSAKSLINTIIVITVTLTLNILYLCWYYANELLKKLRRSTVHQAKSHQIVKKVIVTRNLPAITQVNEDGFGDPSNRYTFSMESFKGKLFVGTSHIKSPIPGIYQFAAGYPLNTEGAQMYSYDDTNNTWKNILAEGFTDKTNFAIRKLKAIDDYLLAVSVNHEKGFEVWGTLNGIDWTCLVGAGFLNKNNSSGRGIEKFGEYVYVTTENRENGAELWRCSSKNIKAALNGKSAEESDSLRHWEKVVGKGFGDSATYWFSDLLVFGDELYMGTMNNIRGFSLFKSKDGKNFTEIAKHGIDSRFNHAAMLLTEFNGELYISTMNWVQGFSVFVMQKRNNEVSFHPVLTKGFNSPHNAYVWQMCEFNGRLYAGSFQNSLLGQRLGMFSLYSSANGRDWEIETDNAFASPLSEKLKFLKYTQKELGDYGIRTLKVHNDRLFIGTATAHGSCKVYMCTAE